MYIKNVKNSFLLIFLDDDLNLDAAAANCVLQNRDPCDISLGLGLSDARPGIFASLFARRALQHTSITRKSRETEYERRHSSKEHGTSEGPGTKEGQDTSKEPGNKRRTRHMLGAWWERGTERWPGTRLKRSQAQAGTKHIHAMWLQRGTRQKRGPRHKQSRSRSEQSRGPAAVLSYSFLEHLCSHRGARARFRRQILQLLSAVGASAAVIRSGKWHANQSLFYFVIQCAYAQATYACPKSVPTRSRARSISKYVNPYSRRCPWLGPVIFIFHSNAMKKVESSWWKLFALWKKGATEGSVSVLTKQ